MSQWSIEAPVDCTGVYVVEADSEEEAKQKLADWDGGGDDCAFSHYSEETPTTSVSEMKATPDD